MRERFSQDYGTAWAAYVLGCMTLPPRTPKSTASIEKTPARDVAALDGRDERVIATVRKTMAEMNNSVNAAVDLSFYNTGDTAVDESSTSTRLKSFVTEATQVLAKIKDCLLRIGRISKVACCGSGES